MNEILINPPRKNWADLMQRPQIDSKNLESVVLEIIETTRENGDKAVKDYSQKFHGFAPENMWVTSEEINEAGNKLEPALKEAILLAKENIEKFHQHQIEEGNRIETSEGVVCWRKGIAIEKVGLYIPGGSAPLFSTLLMLGIWNRENKKSR